MIAVQKKWKGIRTCFARELQRQRKEKALSLSSDRKQYVHFEALQFLEPFSKPTTSSMDDGLTTNASMDHDSKEGIETALEIQKQHKEAGREIHKQPVKRTTDDKEEEELIQTVKRKVLRAIREDDEFMQVVKKKIPRDENASSEDDEDRLFLLSLTSELRKVPAERKLKLKSNIILAISEAQQTS